MGYRGPGLEARVGLPGEGGFGLLAGVSPREAAVRQERVRSAANDAIESGIPAQGAKSRLSGRRQGDGE